MLVYCVVCFVRLGLWCGIYSVLVGCRYWWCEFCWLGSVCLGGFLVVFGRF